MCLQNRGKNFEAKKLRQKFWAANSHAFHHILTLSRWYMLISQAKKNNWFLKFIFCLSEVCDVRRVPLLHVCACKIEAKILRSEKKRVPPPSAHQLFGDLRDFIGWQRTALAFLTPKSEPSSNVGSPAVNAGELGPLGKSAPTTPGSMKSGFSCYCNNTSTAYWNMDFGKLLM